MDGVVCTLYKLMMFAYSWHVGNFPLSVLHWLTHEHVLWNGRNGIGLRVYIFGNFFVCFWIKGEANALRWMVQRWVIYYFRMWLGWVWQNNRNQQQNAIERSSILTNLHTIANWRHSKGKTTYCFSLFNVEYFHYFPDIRNICMYSDIFWRIFQ